MEPSHAHTGNIALFKRIIILFLVSLSPGCAGGGKPQQEFPQHEEIKTILVVPFKNQANKQGEGKTYRCNLCGGMFTTSRVEKGADLFVSDVVSGVLNARQTITLIPNDRVETIRKKLLIDFDQKPSDRVLLSEIGRKLEVDAVLTGSVYKFIQRVGSDFAADTPASIGLDFDLIDVRTGQLIWHARLDETQDYLTNNFLKILTFFKRRGKWITAEKLAASGIKKVLEGSPIP